MMESEKLEENVEPCNGAKVDENGDLLAYAPNPVNPDSPQHSACPKTEPPPMTSEDLSSPVPVSTGAPQITHPPPKPKSALGPYFQFLTTDLEQMLWLGSALILRDISYAQPKIEFFAEQKLDFHWEILYDNIRDMRAYRINIAIELRDGEGDDQIGWKVDWGDDVTNGVFHIAQLNQRWRGGFFSCNGFDITALSRTKIDWTFDDVWEHLESVHEETPLHLLIWGGDQNYIDFMFEDVPYLKQWIDMEWNWKWTCDYLEELNEQVEEYQFNTYVQNWERPEVRKALSTIPSIMQWDDHDIFDGAGSYPPLLHDSPMMVGLFNAAQKLRLLFQHHTTMEKARDHGLFGYQGYNLLARCGPNLLIVGTDGRTERDVETVHHPKSWDMIFEKLEEQITNIAHLIVVFPVPFSFVRFKLAESIFEYLKNVPNKYRQLPLVKQTNSIFGLPELYDDLLDEWTHEAHIGERDRALARFQGLAESKRVRITFFSGDVHCCGISRFQTRTKKHLPPIRDAKLMYQVISSAIVNIPPPRQILQFAHYVKTKWYPIANTEEELIDFFQRLPETGRKIRHRKILPNRNWCYFEQYGGKKALVYAPVKRSCFCLPMRTSRQLFPSIGLGPTSTMSGRGSAEPPIHEHSHKDNCTGGKETTEEEIGTQTLRIRLWLENTNKKEGQQFVSYELLIPNLL